MHARSVRISDSESVSNLIMHEASHSTSLAGDAFRISSTALQIVRRRMLECFPSKCELTETQRCSDSNSCAPYVFPRLALSRQVQRAGTAPWRVQSMPNIMCKSGFGANKPVQHNGRGIGAKGRTEQWSFTVVRCADFSCSASLKIRLSPGLSGDCPAETGR